MSLTEFFIDEHGCAKNQVDGEIIISRLTSLGFRQTFDASKAQIIIVNSCGFINPAKKESIDALLRAKKNYPDAKVLLAGCLAERYADVLKDSLPEADGIFGNGDLSKIDSVVRPLLAGKRPVVTAEQRGISCGKRTMLLSYRNSVYVKITEGCSNRCTFCAIPIIRGSVRSRSADDIVDEIKTLLLLGVYEINLIGQDLAAYGTGDGDDVFGTGRFPLSCIGEDGVNEGTEKLSALARLLKKISALKGRFIVRLLYIHPDHFNRDIFPVMQKDPRIVPYFDIPFQSGDDEIIKSMNRKCTAKEYVRLVRDIRSSFPEAAIRTTFLTGFPGETEEAFRSTQRFLSDIQSDWSGCFTYSREEDTASYGMKGRVPQKTALERKCVLEALQSEITEDRLKLRCGKEYDVLIEEVVAGEEGLAIGRAWFQAPDVDGSFVVRYDRDDEAERSAVQCGNVVRVFADGVSGVDIDSRLVSNLIINKKRSRASGGTAAIPPLLYASDFYDAGEGR